MKGLKISYINNKTIENKAQVFREKFWDDSVPIDIEKIIEVDLKIGVIAISNLQKLCSTVALLASNLRIIYVDKTIYLDERYQNYLRFSLAHEMGHFVLHKNLYQLFGINSTTDLYEFFRKISQEQYSYLESQANKFANYFLVPREILRGKKEDALRRAKGKIDLSKIDDKFLNSYLSSFLSKYFVVSDQVIEIALNDID